MTAHDAKRILARQSWLAGETAGAQALGRQRHAVSFGSAAEDGDMPSTTNVVNLDALIRRADFAAPSESENDIRSLPIMGLEPKGLLYPALRKPDFQRETASWTPEQVSDLICTFLRRDLIPAIILWRSGDTVFVIDGAHRLSALIAWVHNDYGDGEISRSFFQDFIAPEQKRAAQKTRDLVNTEVGAYLDHKYAIEYPQRARPDIAERAPRFGWYEIAAQWINNADADKAEKSFFRINKGGTRIEPSESRILHARHSASALASRAILRAGSGHNYWRKFSEDTRRLVEALGGEIYRLLFEPSLALPIRTLDVPMAGAGYGPHILPFLFDFVNLVNNVAVPEKQADAALLAADTDGSTTIKYLTATRAMAWRLCSSHASSLGLHPALYFYSPSGQFQAAAFLSFVALLKEYDTDEFKKFTSARKPFEEFLMSSKGVTEAIRRLGSGTRSRPRVLSLYKEVLKDLDNQKTVSEIRERLAINSDYKLFFADDLPSATGTPGREFRRNVKGAAYLRDAMPTALTCITCGGKLHCNGMQTGHQIHRRDGGTDSVDNAIMQHPFCNSTVAQ